VSKKIYVASSWRNEYQQGVVRQLREAGHEVYDFRNPAPGEKGFAWSDIDPEWKSWTPAQFREALKHPIAVQGYKRDRDAMEWADTCVLVLPSGKSAHLEAGWMAGAGAITCVYVPELPEPELMYKLLEDEFETLPPDVVCTSMEEVLAYLETFENEPGEERMLQ
jgi:hypothetical protein